MPGGVKPPDGGNPTDWMTPAIEIAWARAISYAFADPAFYRRLKADMPGVLHDLGVDVTEDQIAGALKSKNLRPSLDTLDDVHKTLEKQRAALRAAQGAVSQTSGAIPPYASVAPPSQPCQPATATCAAPCQTSVYVYGTCSPYASAPGFMSSCQFQGHCRMPACVYASQVATTRANTATRSGPPQWVGGPPSGVALATV